jgi:hypothetical protein
VSEHYSSGEAARRENCDDVERKVDPAKVRAHIAAWRQRDEQFRAERMKWSYDHMCVVQIRNRERAARVNDFIASERAAGRGWHSEDLRKRLNQRDHRARKYARRAARGEFTNQDRDRIALGARRLASWIAEQGRQRKALESRQRAVLAAWMLYVKMRREIHVPNGKPPRPVGWRTFGDRLRSAGRGEGERATKNMLARVRELEMPGGPFHGIFTFEIDGDRG